METGFPQKIKFEMKEALLAVIWPRREMIEFFLSNNCTKNDLGIVLDWESNRISRVKIIDTVFHNLALREDCGLGQFRAMLNSLKNWDQFDPYYFTQIKKLDLTLAKIRIRKLQEAVSENADQIRMADKRDRKQESCAETLRQSKDLIKKEFANLLLGKDLAGKIITTQARGYIFERLLLEIAKLEDLEISDPFKIVGEQIDGAIKIDGDHYLVEAKWQEKLTASSSLYQFSHKVEGKLYGRGLFFSINGFSKESVSALTTGKAIKTVLVDGHDLYPVFDGDVPLIMMLQRKIQLAQTKGWIYTSYENGRQKDW